MQSFGESIKCMCLLLLSAESHGPDKEKVRGRGKVQGEDRGWTTRGKASKHVSVLGLRGF